MLKGKIALAYAAGIIDGEGSIVITQAKTKRTKRGYQFTLAVAVRNTNEWLIQWLKFNFGGSVGMSTLNMEKRFGYKPIWYWQMTSDIAMKFLELLLPYLQLKKPQAELAIRFQKNRRHRTDTNVKLVKSDKEWAIEEAEKILMSFYNKGKGRGVED